jgi:hypothetical protein
VPWEHFDLKWWANTSQLVGAVALLPVIGNLAFMRTARVARLLHTPHVAHFRLARLVPWISVVSARPTATTNTTV